MDKINKLLSSTNREDVQLGMHLLKSKNLKEIFNYFFPGRATGTILGAQINFAPPCYARFYFRKEFRDFPIYIKYNDGILTFSTFSPGHIKYEQI